MISTSVQKRTSKNALKRQQILTSLMGASALFLPFSFSYAQAPDQPITSAPTIATKSKPAPVNLRGQDALKFAELLFQQGKIEEALLILRQLAEAKPENVDTVQVAFLIGMIAAEKKDYKEAVEIFRKVLDVAPNLIRVRLELARSLFELKRDRAAAYHFRLTLTQDLEPAVKENIRQFLYIIERRKKWHFSFAASILPNTNINSGLQGDVNLGPLILSLDEFCNQDSVTQISGPINVDQSLCAESGIGLSSSLSASYQHPITKNLKGQIRVSGRLSDYSARNFDDAFGSIEAGILHHSKRLSTQALVTATKRTFGGRDFSQSIGSKLILTTPLSSRTRFSVNISAADFDYETNPGRDGLLYSTGINVTHFLDQRTFLAGSLQGSIEDTEAEFQQTQALQISATIGREFPFGVNARLTPQYYIRDFTNTGRRDETYAASITLTKRDWRWHGFAPALTYMYQSNQSTEDRFTFDRHLVDIGVTRNF